MVAVSPFMKTKWAVGFLLLSFVLAVQAVEIKKSEKKALPKPVLKEDLTPLSEGKAPALTSYADMLDLVRPTVVSVYSSKVIHQQVPPLLRQFYGPNVRGREERLDGLGSGVIISSDGYILTNNHVVADADELKVKLNDDRELIAKVIGSDPKTDVAVIKIDADKLPAATLANSDKLRVGDVVFAIGNPLGVGQTVTMGIISATGRRVGLLQEVEGYEDFIQTDASINKGNSGGALIDAKGRLVGINSAIISNNQGSIGIGFAIPVNLARTIMNSLVETGTVSRGYLGVSTEVLTPELAESFELPKETKGVVVNDITSPDGPAGKAGLKTGDIIVAVNDRPVISGDDLRLMIAETLPGSKVKIKYLRDGKSGTTEVTLGRLEDAVAAGGEWLPGVTISPITDQVRNDMRISEELDGVVITDVSDQSRYNEFFPVGAVIEQINRLPVTNLASAKQALRDGRNMALLSYRGVFRYVIFYVR